MATILRGVTCAFSMLASGLSTLVMVIFTLAGGANATPEVVRNLKLFVLGIAWLWLASATGGGWLMWTLRPWLGAIVAAAPTAVLLGMSVYAAWPRR